LLQTGLNVPSTVQPGATATRKRVVKLDDLTSGTANGFSPTVKSGFGVAVVGGADPANVAAQGFVVNSHAGAFDLSVFGYSSPEVNLSRQ
jgi:hypothetical protein